MTDIEQIINNLADTLIEEGVEKIILFGSYAYGMPNGKPTLEEAEIYFKEALKIKEQVESFLLNTP